MIITAGKYKGQSIKNIKTGKVRPTSSKIRESIFNIAQLSPEGTIFYEGKTCFLDLFAGSGVMGLEAISRGAERVVFVEKNYEAIKILKQNISIAEDSKKLSVFIGDAIKVLHKFKENEFNFIFIDPPYESGLYEPVLKKVKTHNILKKNGIIVLEHNSKVSLSELALEYGFKIYKTRVYGDTAITIIHS